MLLEALWLLLNDVLLLQPLLLTTLITKQTKKHIFLKLDVDKEKKKLLTEFFNC